MDLTVCKQPSKGRRDPARASYDANVAKLGTPLNDRIKEMMTANDGTGPGALERKNSFTHLLDKRDAFYRKKEVRLSMGELVVDCEFSLGVPRIIFDVVEAFTGFDIAGELSRELYP